MVSPILEYCTVIWYPLFKTDALEIEKVQRRATKLVPELKDLPYEERLKSLNITTLAYRRERSDMLQVFRIVKQIDKIPFDTFFTLNPRNRGHPYKLFKPSSQTRMRLNSFSQRVIDPWNDLPYDFVICETINGFKNALEKAWLNNPIKYNFE